MNVSLDLPEHSFPALLSGATPFIASLRFSYHLASPITNIVRLNYQHACIAIKYRFFSMFTMTFRNDSCYNSLTNFISNLSVETNPLWYNSL